jgi:hypothetical protein
MHLLFALGDAHRRQGHSELIMARVLKIETLHVDIARKKYPFAAEQACLSGLAAKWRVTKVCCIVLDKHIIRLAREIVKISKGCLGMVRQFAHRTGAQHFCQASLRIHETSSSLARIMIPGALNFCSILPGCK